MKQSLGAVGPSSGRVASPFLTPQESNAWLMNGSSMFVIAVTIGINTTNVDA